ncbi:MAG: antA/AntB antirepressor family protein [Enterovibrio sp.]
MKKLLSVKEFKEIKNALKETKQGDLVKTVNARDVHAWLEVKTPFHKWIKRRIDSLMLIENIDYVVVGENVSQASNDGLDKFVQRDFQGKIEYHLSQDAVKQLAMGEDGEKGKLVKLYFIDCETVAKAKLEELEARKVSKVEFRPMTDAILEAHETPKPYHYSNECDMINRIIFGMTAAEFRLHHNMKKDDQLRDWLTPMQLTAVIELQRANTVLIKFGKTFQERKIELQSYFDRNYSQKLIQEIFALEA